MPAPAETGPTGARPPSGEDVRDRWNTNAGWWDETVGDGNATQRLILGPATERLLGPVSGLRVLDVACGNGHSARRFADLGAHVVAVDFSEQFLERARRRSGAYGDRIEFRRADATREDELRALAPPPFDAAVCTMALMDMVETPPLFRSLGHLLRPGAPFVFSVTHPVFNQVAAVRGREESDGPGGVIDHAYVRVDRYRSGGPGLGTGIVGQPVSHWYFERSITDLLAPAFAAGFVVDALEELACPPEMASTRPLAWPNFPEHPPFLIVRTRHPPPEVRA